MKDYEIWLMITHHLSKDETELEKEVFFAWLHQNPNNQLYFERVKKVWDAEEKEETGITEVPKLSLMEQLTLPNIIDFISKQALGNIIGIAVGLWVSKTFTHSVIERRSLDNLFGLAHRKTTVVNEIPHWLQTTISILVGYLALEIVHFFLQSKQVIAVWKWIQKKATPYLTMLKMRVKF
ncbi:MAG: hypothetical protein CFE21_13780 [Bacteroidetes bacterium B1(2017)]|nr:MAG: hypothetical protein CFE21_13780 [Bacteroidetes bacterium B1(2017)]